MLKYKVLYVIARYVRVVCNCYAKVLLKYIPMFFSSAPLQTEKHTP